MVLIVIGFLLMLLAWQDFKYRAVYWWLFPVLTVLFTDVKFVHDGFWDGWNVLANVAFIFFQLVFLTLYLSWRQKKWVWIWKGFLGLGDIAFLFSLSTLLPLVNFIIFYIVSLFLAVIIAIFGKVMGSKSQTIPFAGEQAVFLMVAFAATFLSQDWHLLEDLPLNHWSL